MHTPIVLSEWDSVRDWVDDLPFPISPSYLAESSDPKYPRDAFTLGQLASKAWLLKELYPIATHPIPNWVIIGSWIGTLVPFLHNKFIINRIYGIDLDAKSVELSEVFNRRYVEDNWKYKGVVMDITYQDTNWLQFETGYELIQVKPGVIINTSCEHMDNSWFNGADSDQLIVMQTNNNNKFDGHINVCASINEMTEQYPLSTVLFKGELVMPSYTRYMQIGYK